MYVRVLQCDSGGGLRLAATPAAAIFAPNSPGVSFYVQLLFPGGEARCRSQARARDSLNDLDGKAGFVISVGGNADTGDPNRAGKFKKTCGGRGGFGI